MGLRLYDTAVRAVREFVPLQPGRVGIYLCGATVQGEPHVGHIRSGVCFDVLRRWLERSGYEVTFVRNVTDIDDKILARAAEAGVGPFAWAYRHERAFSWAYDVLGCRPPTVEPRATGHIPEMVALIARLVGAGHAYPAAGDVYFDVRSFAGYGELSGQRPDQLQAGDSDAAGKRDPLDFALWKAAKPGEPFWDTPWGPGRPGWHLECSAMATKYLGPSFDIHAAGVDLVFPHNENERAQSQAAGDPFAGYWLHNAWITQAGEKMSKSLGNTLLVSDVVRRVSPAALRYYLVAPHYRSHVEFSEEALAEAAAGYGRLVGFVQRAAELVGPDAGLRAVCADFAVAMDDDLGVPAALAALHEVVREGNVALSKGDKAAVAGTLGSVRAMLDVLGLDPLAEAWASAGPAGESGRLRTAVDRLVALVLAEREAARARRDYAAADRIRGQLAAAGVLVEDTPDGSRWSLGDLP